METWILIITTLAGAGQPTGITNIPGYPSLEVCQAAKAVIEHFEGEQDAKSRDPNFKARCIPGPKK